MCDAIVRMIGSISYNNLLSRAGCFAFSKLRAYLYVCFSLFQVRTQTFINISITMVLVYLGDYCKI